MLHGCGKAKHWNQKTKKYVETVTGFANTYKVAVLLDIHIEIRRYQWDNWSSEDKIEAFLAVTLAA